MARERIFSGMRPTGPLHLGNYFGALRNWVTLQDDYECFFSIADWHSLTTEYAEPGNVREWTNEVMLDWLAAGLDPNKCTIFIQSQVRAHAELHPLGWLERVPTYKQLREELQSRDLNMYGFLGYPVLQTADIILYRAQLVPVGEDQLAHIELAREIVRRFNHLYNSELFPEPRPLMTQTPKVPGLDGRKMSKSYGNGIYLKDSAEEVREKIMPAMTDPARKRRSDPGNPDICLVYAYHQLFSDQQTIDLVDRECRQAGIGCVDDKKMLLERMEGVLGPLRERRADWAARPNDVRDILHYGQKRASEVAEETMVQVRQAMGVG